MKILPNPIFFFVLVFLYSQSSYCAEHHQTFTNFKQNVECHLISPAIGLRIKTNKFFALVRAINGTSVLQSGWNIESSALPRNCDLYSKEIIYDASTFYHLWTFKITKPGTYSLEFSRISNQSNNQSDHLFQENYNLRASSEIKADTEEIQTISVTTY